MRQGRFHGVAKRRCRVLKPAMVRSQLGKAQASLAPEYAGQLLDQMLFRGTFRRVLQTEILQKRLVTDYMETLPPGAEWLFPSPGAREGHTVDIRKPFVRCVIAAGLDPKQVVRHTLRHTAITHLVQAGIDLPTVKRISGHKTLAMVERYAHQSGSHIADAMEKLDDRYRSGGRQKA